MKRLEVFPVWSHKLDWQDLTKADELLIQKPILPMTQIVGIICRESIIVACESQYTVGTRKLLNAVKMSVVKFKNGEALIAESGSMAKSSLALRYINESAKDKEIESEYSVSEIAEDAIVRVRNRLLSAIQKRPYSVSEQDAIFKSGDNYFALMIANYFRPKSKEEPIPCLFTITLASAITERERPFAVLGAAPELAMFFLKQFQCEQMLGGEAMCLAIDTLERIKLDEITCGGQVRVAILDPKILETKTVGFLRCDDTDHIVEKLTSLRAKHTDWYKSKLAELMKQVQKEDYQRLKKQLESEFGPLKDNQI